MRAGVRQALVLIDQAIAEACSDALADVCQALEMIARDEAGEAWDEWLAQRGIRTTGDVAALIELCRALDAVEVRLRVA